MQQRSEQEAVEGYGADDFDVPDRIDQAVLAAGPEATFRDFLDSLRQVRTGIDPQF